MKDANVGGYAGALGTMFLATGITLETVQIIYYILGALALLFSISLTVYKWYKAAKADGKITADEVEDLVNQVENKINKGDKK